MRRALFSLLLVFSLVGCSTIPGRSAGTDGGQATSGNLAQTARDQASAGVTGTSGTSQASIDNIFAAKVDSAVALRALEIAEELGWSADEVARILGSLVAAPDTVTIEGDQSVESTTGQVESLGSGSSDGSGIGTGNAPPIR